MSPIQQMLLGVGAVAKKTYVDDVFSTFLYEGTSSSHTINNGIDLSGEGGLVWFKNRSSTYSHSLIDTVRGKTKRLTSNDTVGEVTWTDTITSFNNNGFTLGTSDDVNDDDMNFTSWTFRKSPGFFDVVTYTGSGSAKTVSHSLGSIPGCIIVKCTTDGRPWAVYHRGMGNGKAMPLNSTNAEHDSTTYWNDTDPTASVFTLGTANDTNKSGETYVAYLFAGGEVDNNSVQFDGTDDYLTVPQSSDYDLGTGEFTWECWVRHEGTVSSQNAALFDTRNNSTGDDGYYAFVASTGKFRFIRSYGSSQDTAFDSTSSLSANTWYHLAASRDSSNNVRIFVNGTLESTATNSLNFGCSTGMHIGFRKHTGSSLTYFKSKISNFRLTKGQCLYTANFTPATTPLTTSSQSATAVKLLCCNGSTATSTSKIGSGSITMTSSPVSSSITPFTLTGDAFSFGDAGDQNVIKCGSYVGNGSATGPEIYLGWEPQWLLIKESDGTSDWTIFDSMRGIVSNGGDYYLHPNSSSVETENLERVDLTSTGFKITDSGWINNNTKKYIFCAIRRPDGYVGKPPELGTDVFAMDYGNSSEPTFDSGFPVDFALLKRPAATSNFLAQSRLSGDHYLFTNSTQAEVSHPGFICWDSSVGWAKEWNNLRFSWMFKRHAGLDVVAYQTSGSSGVEMIPHSMNKAPEMYWIKVRTSGGANDQWAVYHKGLNGGTNPDQYYLWLNSTNAETSSQYYFGAAPTTSHFAVSRDNGRTGDQNQKYIAMLFASVDGISSVGSYSGSNSSQTITTGFQPRFLIIKNATLDTSWQVLDTTRGWASGNDKRLFLDTNSEQSTGDDVGQPTSTGFTLTGGDTRWNNASHTFIYYAHA